MTLANIAMALCGKILSSEKYFDIEKEWLFLNMCLLVYVINAARAITARKFYTKLIILRPEEQSRCEKYPSPSLNMLEQFCRDE